MPAAAPRRGAARPKPQTGSEAHPSCRHSENAPLRRSVSLKAMANLDALAAKVEERLGSPPPHVVGVGGAVDVDADEAAVKEWFAQRFVRLTREARAGAESFYSLFASMSDDEVREAAEGTWDAINGPNLHQHIAATRANAMIVVEKDADHT